MAAPKNKSENGTRSNRIRFVMLEADLSDGNLSELTHAITSALKPSGAPVRHLPTRPAPPAVIAPSEDATTIEEIEEVSAAESQEVQADEENGAAQRTPKPKSKPPLPKYLPDLDVKGNGISFKEYATEKAPASHLKRYLVATMWLKEHGNSSTINTDKVYTLYKTATWPLGITDWDVNFRSLLKKDHVRRVGPGEYAITPLGESALQGKADD